MEFEEIGQSFKSFFNTFDTAPNFHIKNWTKTNITSKNRIDFKDFGLGTEAANLETSPGAKQYYVLLEFLSSEFWTKRREWFGRI